MRYMQVACVLAALALLGTAKADAADHGQISGTTLSQLGMGGMEVLSDAQGLAVRGKGFSKGSSVTQVAKVTIKANSSAHHGKSETVVILAPKAITIVQVAKVR